MRRSALCLALLATIVLSPAASAVEPIRVVNPQQDDGVIRHQCGSAIRLHVDGREIITTFLDRADDAVKQIVVFPGNTLTFTNMSTGTARTLQGTGATQLRATGEGGLEVSITGHGPFFPHPITGEPGIWYLSGHGRAT